MLALFFRENNHRLLTFNFSIAYMSMTAIDTLIGDFSNQNVKFFFENKITSFRPEKEVFEGILNWKDHFSHPIKIGQAELADGSELLVFSCESKNTITARSSKKQQFEIARKVLKEDFKDGAIFVFYDDQKNFRFSFIRRFYGEEKKFTNWKRFTYYVRPDETNKTFKKRLNECSFKGLDAIQEAFSVEKLTKEFYSDLFNWYQWVLSEEVGATFPENLKDKNIHLEEQIIRLITRLLFVWFIRQKKLIPGKLFEVDELKKILNSFDPGSKKEGNYYNAILQNLFFATLNKPVADRGFTRKKDNRDLKTLYRYSEMFTIPENKVMEIFKPIPFLNGGLFECLDKEESTDGLAVHLDGFSRNADKDKNGQFKHRAFIPNSVFFGDGGQNEGLIPLLNRYNFTVEENVPNEVQVALDPELLGNVFENLLGTFNPETKETARNESGSFYTPKDIVGAMVKESLFEFLKTHLPKLNNSILRAVVEDEELPAELMKDHSMCGRISDALRSIKILDPACGSGAYPMGILNKMVQILEKLDVKNKETHYNLKLHLIEECIYGVDIQTIAAQISKLRFFISLIVEQEQPDLSRPEDNYGVITLPNLETKFVSANTLISPTKENTDLLDLSDQELKKKKAELLDIRKKHFYANSTYKKMKLRKEDEALRKEIEAYLIARDTRTDEQKIKIYEAQIEKLKEERKKNEKPDWVEEKGMAQQLSLYGREAKQVSLFRKDKNAEKRKEIGDKITNLERAIRKEEYKAKRTGLEGEITEILKWDPYNQNKSSEWFDPEWMFGVSRFDVIIGNPPYIKEYTNRKAFDGFRDSPYYKGKMDLWHGFVCVCIDLLNEHGILTFIAQNNWVTNSGASIMRNKIITQTRIVKLFDFYHFKIFKSADIQTMIMVFKKDNRTDNYTIDYRKLSENKTELNDVIKLLMKENNGDIIFEPTINRASFINKYILFHSIEVDQVLLKVAQLKNFFLSSETEVAQGIVIPQDYLNNKNKRILGKNFSKGEGIFVLNSDELKRLLLKPEELELIKPYYESNSLKRYYGARRTNQWIIYTNSSYNKPNSLNKYPNIKKHLDRFSKIITSDNKPYGLHRARVESFFKGKKIISLRKCPSRPVFTYTDFDCYVSETFYVIKTDRINLKYLTGLLNSNLIKFWLLYKGKMQGANFQIDKTPLLQLPILVPKGSVEKEIETFINTILSKKENDEDTTYEEQQIDLMVYRLYDLTYDEVLIVDPEFGMSRKDYETGKG